MNVSGSKFFSPPPGTHFEIMREYLPAGRAHHYPDSYRDREVEHDPPVGG